MKHKSRICEYRNCGKRFTPKTFWGKYCCPSHKVMEFEIRKKEALRKADKSLRKPDTSRKKLPESLRKSIVKEGSNYAPDKEFVEKNIVGLKIALKYVDDQDREYLKERIEVYERALTYC